MSYYVELSKNIEESRNIKWENLKKLRAAKKDPEQLDLNDLSNFYKFFKNLYDEQLKTSTNDYPEPNFTDILTERSELEDLQESLNSMITIEELNVLTMLYPNSK